MTLTTPETSTRDGGCYSSRRNFPHGANFHWPRGASHTLPVPSITGILQDTQYRYAPDADEPLLMGVLKRSIMACLPTQTAAFCPGRRNFLGMARVPPA